MDASKTAKGLASLGRNGDSVLVHMQPSEVAGLQHLAEAHGTSLTVNPHTGMPEAFSLGGVFRSMLPLAAGAGMAMIPGMQFASPAVMGALTGAAIGAMTNKKDPLMGAVTGGASGYSGAGLANTLSSAGQTMASSALAPATESASNFGVKSLTDLAGSANPLSTSVPAFSQATTIPQASAMSSLSANPAITSGLPEVGPNMGAITKPDSLMAGVGDSPLSGNSALTGGSTSMASGVGVPFSPTTPTFSSNADNLMTGIKGLATPEGRAAYQNAGGSMTDLLFPAGSIALGGLEQSDLYPTNTIQQSNYDPKRRLNLNEGTRLNLSSYANGGAVGVSGANYTSSDIMTPPQLSAGGYGIGRLENMTAAQTQESAKQGMFAVGGKLEEGSFIIPADVVSHIGNGSSDAGLKHLAKRYGARPIRGAGDGMSDDIPAKIGGKQEARVADGEAYIPKKSVAAHGGPKKFYDMMDRVRKARTGSTKQGKQINPEDFV